MVTFCRFRSLCWFSRFLLDFVERKQGVGFDLVNKCHGEAVRRQVLVRLAGLVGVQLTLQRVRNILKEGFCRVPLVFIFFLA